MDSIWGWISFWADSVTPCQEAIVFLINECSDDWPVRTIFELELFITLGDLWSYYYFFFLKKRSRYILQVPFKTLFAMKNRFY